MPVCKVLVLLVLIVDQIIFFLVVEVVVILPMVELAVAVKQEEVHLLEIHNVEQQEQLILVVAVVELVDLGVMVPKKVVLVALV